MHALITGAAGMIGRKLVERLARDGAPDGKPLDQLTLVDVVEPAAPADFGGGLTRMTLDLASPGSASSTVAGRPDVIFHLAAVVSGEAEADLEKGYRVNFGGTRNLLDAVRLLGATTGWAPRVVFASSMAVFGGDMPDVIGDDFFLTPQTSYGAQKAMCEHLLADYSRRGFIRGIGIRLPTTQGSPIRRPRASFQASSASRLTARRRSCPSARMCATAWRARDPRSAFSSMQ
jgi:nucleoside-diphosphate-sugar epimerase